MIARTTAGDTPRTGAARAAAATLATVLAVGLLAASCSSSGSGSTSAGTEAPTARANTGLVVSDAPPHRGGRVVYGLIAETNGWNPTTNQWAASGLEVAHTIFDTLTAFDDKSQIHPYFAESYDHDAGYLNWTIKLRHGVKFTNGRPADAHAVAKLQNLFKQSPIVGGVYQTVDSIEATDDDTVAFHLNKPFTQLPVIFGAQIGVVADPDWIATNDSLHPVGTGPFELETWEINNKLVVKRNADYWRKDNSGVAYPYLDSVEFRVITDSNARGVAIRAGDIDIMQSLSGEQIQSFQGADGYQVLSNPKGETRERFVMLNTQAAPFDDPDARLALAYATDQQQVIDTVTGGFNEPATGPFATSSPWYADSGYPKLDTAKAKELVDKVKASHGGKFEFTVSGVSEPQTQQQTQILQQQWSAVGIDAKVDLQEQAKLIITVVTGKYQSVSWGQFDAPNPILDGVWMDPKLAFEPPTFSLNFARLKDEAIGDALLDSHATTDQTKIKQDFATVQQRLGADVPYIWLYHEQTAIIAKSRLVNIARYTLPDGATGLDVIQGSHPLWQVWLNA